MIEPYSSDEQRLDAEYQASIAMLRTAWFVLLSALLTILTGVTLLLSSAVTFGMGLCSLLLWGLDTWRSAMGILQNMIQSQPEMQRFRFAGK